MRKTVIFTLAMLMLSPSVHATDILEWLDESTRSLKQEKAAVSADGAILLTLQSRESEMYPQPSPDGKSLLALSQRGKQASIARFSTTEGQMINLVSDDLHALDSVGWKESGKIYFLSDRAGGLGLWEKISDGEGMQRRIQSLHGALTQPLLLADESIIAVRLIRIDYKQKKVANSSRDDFNNWNFKGFKSEIVRFFRDGSEKVLAEGINPALAPDGNSIAFSMQAGRSMHLFRVNIDGSDLIQITDARSEDVQPAWSSDGKSILFTSNRSNADMRKKGKVQWDIWMIGADGRNLRQITSDKARDGAARMDNHGRIYFHSDRQVSKAEQKMRQIKSVSSHSFHIWTITASNNVQ